MVDICLVPNPAPMPLAADHSPYVPLGLLSLATVLAPRRDVRTEILDPHRTDGAPPAVLARRIAERDAHIVGFSTMCNSYPLILRTAQELKCLQPDVMIMLGGPHASVVDTATLDTFPFVDFVLRGECEEAITDFADYVVRARPLEEVANLTYRRDGVATRTDPAYDVLAPDDLPEIDYGHLPEIGRYERVPLDVGRGCPFGCTFCTTNIFWERRYRLRSSAYIVRTARRLRDEFGVSDLAFEHDNLTANKKQVAALCEDLLTADVRFSWTCSARPDCLTPQLLDLMAASGCHGIFMGIESGSNRIQRLCKKNLKVDRVLPTVRELRAHSIQATASFIVGFPYEMRDDIEATLRCMLDINATWFGAMRLQLHLLSPVPGASLVAEPGVRVALDSEASDISAAGDLDPVALAWIADHPSIFESFYHFLSEGIERRDLLRIRRGWFTTFTHLPATALAIHAADASHDAALVNIFADTAPTEDDTDVEWCARRLTAFMRARGTDAYAAALSVLQLEDAVHRVRLTGTPEIVSVDHPVEPWIRAGDATVQLPSRQPTQYLVLWTGDAVSVNLLSAALLPAVAA
jgi:radical SAM superfamily enzyme YgiQ (UPF0313 family)